VHPPRCDATHNDPQLCAATTRQGTTLSDPATGRPAGAPLETGSGTAGGVYGVAFSPGGKLLASADADGTVLLWNPATGRPAGAPLQAGARNGALWVAFSPDGKLLASGDSDGTVLLWNPATGRPVGAPLHASAVNGAPAVAFSPDGRLLASAGLDGTVRLWQLSLFADPYAALCADARPPTRPEWNHYAFGEPQPKACS
jgi:WD40 repeat protein